MSDECILDKKAAAKKTAKQYDSLTGTELVRLKNSANPADQQEYQRLRQGKVDCRELTPESGGARQKGTISVSRYEETPATLSEKDEQLIKKYPREDVERLYKADSTGSKDNLGTMDPDTRSQVRRAAVLHGILK